MSNPDNNQDEDAIEDSDIMDDSIEDDVWDESIDEDWSDDDSLMDDADIVAEEGIVPPPLVGAAPNKPTKKKKSKLVPLLLILILGGGGAGGAFLFLNNQTQLDEVSYPPVVQNVMPEQQNNSNPVQPSMDAEVTSNTTPIEEGAIATPKESAQSDPGVLTPMPDPDAIKDTDLAMLDSQETDDLEMAIPLEEPETKTDDVLKPQESLFLDDKNAPRPSIPDISEAMPVEEELPSLTLESDLEPEEEVLPLEEEIMLEKTEITPEEPKDTNIIPELKLEESVSPVSDEPVKAELVPEPVIEKEPMVKEAPKQEKPAEVQKNPNSVVENVKTPEPVEVSKDIKQPEVKQPEVKQPEVKQPEVKQPVKTEKPVEKVVKAEEKTEKTAPKYAASSWVLRSAQNGQAVIYDKRSGETKSIETGNHVSGLGTIKSISKVDGKWVVKGTQGSVKQ